MKLPMPVVCECGFNTMDAEEAIKHIEEKHPECWKDEDKYTPCGTSQRPPSKSEVSPS